MDPCAVNNAGNTALHLACMATLQSVNAWRESKVAIAVDSGPEPDMM